MLTYFEVDPDCRFASHSHASEQITMVLEGGSISSKAIRLLESRRAR